MQTPAENLRGSDPLQGRHGSQAEGWAGGFRAFVSGGVTPVRHGNQSNRRRLLEGMEPTPPAGALGPREAALLAGFHLFCFSCRWAGRLSEQRQREGCSMEPLVFSLIQTML